MENSSRLLEFIVNHWELSAAFAGVLAVLVVTEIRRKLHGVPQLGPHAATQTMNAENALVLDVRENAEYQQGHLVNAVHIPLGQLNKRLKELEKYRDRPVLAYCRTGSRSNSAASLLQRQGFNTVFNLAGGIVAWQNANLPVTKK
jgi:rhodanese-related sulfurtransferase